MNIFTFFNRTIECTLHSLIKQGKIPEGVSFDRVTVESPKDPTHGDISTNVALVLAKGLQKPPRDVAHLFAKELEKLMSVEEVSIAGPGFINLKLSHSFWQNHLSKILELGDTYGNSEMGQGENINVEYVSANPTGPLHAGHGRVAIVADVLCNVLEKAGYQVTREFYINDAGGQADILARSTYLRYLEALGDIIAEIPEGYYPGDYLKEVGQHIALQEGAQWKDRNEKEWLPLFRRWAVDLMMKTIKEDLDLVGIHQDIFFSEEALQKSGGLEKALDTLKEKDLAYEGVLEKPKGKTVEDWEPKPLLLFRSTPYGDEVDRPLKKSTGAWTYFAADIAYHFDKYQRGFKKMINVWGADHGGYVKRITSGVEAITERQGHLHVVICQIVNFIEDGQPLKMSKRAGTFITLKDVVEKIGKDVLRFMMVTRKPEAHFDFDFAKALEQSKDNPVFYVQYAYARIHSVLRMAKEAFPDREFDIKTANFELLSDKGELQLMKRLAEWPRQIEAAAHFYEPHRLAYYLHDVASDFHTLWNKGKDNTLLRFIISEDYEKTLARLGLLKAVTLVIASGLHLFGVEPREEMRG